MEFVAEAADAEGRRAVGREHSRSFEAFGARLAHGIGQAQREFGM